MLMLCIWDGDIEAIWALSVERQNLHIIQSHILMGQNCNERALPRCNEMELLQDHLRRDS